METKSAGVQEFAWIALAVQAVFAGKVLCLAVAGRRVIRARLCNAAATLHAFMLRHQVSKRGAAERVWFEEVREQRFRMTPSYMVCCLVVSQFVLLAARYSALQNGWLQPGAYWTTLALCLINLSYLFIPGVLSKSSMDCWYVLHMMFCALYLSPWCVTPAPALNASFALLGCIRLPSILLASRPFLVVACNAAVGIVVLFRTMSEEWALPACDIFDSAYTILASEVLGFFLTAGVAFLLDGLLHQKVRHDIRYRDTTSQLGAASSLLRLTCDAIVEVDSNLRITEARRHTVPSWPLHSRHRLVVVNLWTVIMFVCLFMFMFCMFCA